MIDNVVLVLTGVLHERSVQVRLVESAFDPSNFDSMHVPIHIRNYYRNATLLDHSTQWHQ